MGQTIKRNKCLRCDYEWWPRTVSRSRLCPNCRSVYWDKPKIDIKKTYQKKDNTA